MIKLENSGVCVSDVQIETASETVYPNSDIHSTACEAHQTLPVSVGDSAGHVAWLITHAGDSTLTESVRKLPEPERRHRRIPHSTT